MAQCTAPREGHRTASGAANCPVCRYRSSRRSSYPSSSDYTPRPTYTVPAADKPTRHSSYASRRSGGGSGGGGSSSSSRARRAAVSYSTSEYRTLNPVHEHVVRLAETDRRDLFLCHAWDDRAGAALEFYNLLTGLDVKVWFSEKDVPLGTPLMRQIDKGLKSSRAGIVLVTPALLKSLNAEGIADKELSVLLSTGRVIPIAHGTTFQELLDVSPLLASHSGLTTADYASLDEVATKIADTVLLD